MANNNDSSAGFSFDDDDEDLEAMFAAAAKGEVNADTESDSDIFFDDAGIVSNDNYTTQEPLHNSYQNEQPYHGSQQTQTEDQYATVGYQNESTSFTDETLGSQIDYEDSYEDETEVVTDRGYVEQYSQPETQYVEPETQFVEQEQYVEPEPYQQPQQHYVEPTYTPEPQQHVSQTQGHALTNQTPQHFNSKPAFRKESDFIAETRKVIRVLDVYRGLTDDEKNMAMQLVFESSDIDINNESELIVKVITADPMIYKTVANLENAAKERNRVSRVFYILRLPTNELHSLGSLVQSLSAQDIEYNQSDNIGFSESIEAEIDKIETSVINLIAATQTLLGAAEETPITE